MREFLEFIFTLESKAGQSIVWTIVCLSVLGLVNFLWHLLYKLPWEMRNLDNVRRYFKEGAKLDELDRFLDKLREIGIADNSAIYKRIEQLIGVKNNQGYIDHDALSAILAGHESIKASLAQHILSIVIIFGLIGTLWGLSSAIIEVSPLIVDIEQFDDLSKIAQVIRETLAGMSTAFATTLTGLLMFLFLGCFGLLFRRQQSVFLTEFEEFVSIEIMPHFAPTSVDSIQPIVSQLVQSTNILKFATKENIAVMRQAIQQLTDTSWGGHLEQEYALANQFGETSDNLLKSLNSLGNYQSQVKIAFESFERLTEDSMSQITQSRNQFQEMLDNSLEKSQSQTKSIVESFEKLTAESMSEITQSQRQLRESLDRSLSNQSQKLEAIIKFFQNSQSEFINDLSAKIKAGNEELISHLTGVLDLVKTEMKSIVQPQQEMALALTELSSELKVRSSIDRQNQIFEQIEAHLNRSEDYADEQEKLLHNLDGSLQAFNKNISARLNRSIEEELLYEILGTLEELNDRMGASSIRRLFLSRRRSEDKEE